MATRSGRPFASTPLDGLVTSLYRAGVVLVAAGLVVDVFAYVTVLEATGSFALSTAATMQALSGPVVGPTPTATAIHGGTIVVCVGLWLLGAGSFVEGYVES
jgi:hypothetical protein